MQNIPVILKKSLGRKIQYMVTNIHVLIFFYDSTDVFIWVKQYDCLSILSLNPYKTRSIRWQLLPLRKIGLKNMLNDFSIKEVRVNKKSCIYYNLSITNLETLIMLIYVY